MPYNIKSKTAQKILNFFFIHKKEKFYISQIAKFIQEDKSNVHKKLLELYENEILLDEYIGNQRYFFLNNDFRFLKEYEKIVSQTFGIEAILKEELLAIGGIDNAFIFGSYAQNKLNPSSDLDILIVGSHDGIKLSKKLAQLQKE
jgi:predicted nucleotidyltransferase/predicted transcriptional regulator with HTH domain